MTENPNAKSKSQEAELDDVDNPPVYKKMKHKDKYKKRARSLYYYHAEVTSNGLALTAKNFFYNNGSDKIDEEDIEEIVKVLALNARQDEGYVPPMHDTNFGDTWRKKSFIVILLDDENYRFRGNESSLEIEYGGNYSKNYSFFDAVDFDVDLAVGENIPQIRSAIYFMNHMKKNHEGDDIYKIDGVPEKQKFKLKLYFGQDRSFSPYTAEGTNMGPPVAPPLIPL